MLLPKYGSIASTTREVDDIRRRVIDDERMIKHPAFVLFVILALGCASANHSPAGDFDVTIEQTDASAMGGRGEILARMEFAVTVTNRTAYPWRVDAVSLQSVTATHFTVPPTPQPWGQLIAPAGSNELSFWSVVQATINFTKLKVPMRVRIDLTGPNGEKRTETFTRDVEAWLSGEPPRG